MIPRILIDSAEMPDGGETLRLFQRGEEFSIMLGATELMNSRVSGSEEALASLVCQEIEDRAQARILIGGLGMGFTLRAALKELGKDAVVEVVELVPAVIEWAHGPLKHIFAGCLDDPRVHLIEADVARVIASEKEGYDAILLDVDNGPDGLSHAGNSRLYHKGGLQTAKSALRSGGVLAVWSSAPDPAFTNRLSRTGFAVDEKVVRARGDKGPRHVIWLAAKP